MTKKTHTYPLKTTLAAIFIIVAVILGVYGAGIYQIYHFNGKMEIPEGDENVILRIHPDDKGYVYTIVGIPYTIDMGSRHSFITPHTLEILKQHGIDGEEQQTLLYTTDQSGHYNFYTRKVVRPMYFFPNSTSTDTVTFNKVEMMISDREEGNVLGMDFLEKFVIEYDNDTRTISLLRHVPEGYSYVCDLNGHDSAIGDLFGYSRRVYVPLKVNDEDPQNYYLDTGRGIRNCELVQPLKDIGKATSPILTDSVTGLEVQPNCRVQIGDRLRFARVTYSDSLHTDEYSVNPFRVFNHSIVLDLPAKKLYYHK
ncbi:MAG: hypothetical protein K2G15_04135 [Muribaculaceae bacterium]|nr:hypothetical protein [Muribaculaceae bacterium]MDE6427860.1 hypothetical protein [Muribaculaceae bacterium]